MKPKRSWVEKLRDDKGLPRVVETPPRMRRAWGTGPMVIPAPREVDALMKCVRPGRVTTINEIRAALAARHNVNVACPMTTGIFAWIAAGAAEELRAAGQPRITPYWRTLKSGGEINAKYPGGADAVAKRLRKEGHRVVRKGSKMFVADFEKKLTRFK